MKVQKLMINEANNTRAGPKYLAKISRISKQQSTPAIFSEKLQNHIKRRIRVNSKSDRLTYS
jgi:hypothetical protein